MDLKSSGLGRLSAIQTLFARTENAQGASISKLFKDSFSHQARVDTALANKIVEGVTNNREKLDALFAEYGKEDSSLLFRCFFDSMAYEVLWLKKSVALIWSEYKCLADLFFPETLSKALKAILNNLATK